MFSVALFADLLRTGKKFVFFTAFGAAKDELHQLLEGSGLETELRHVDDPSQIESPAEHRGLVVDGGDPDLLVEVLGCLPDAKERFVLVKNMETILTTDLFTCLRRQGRFVLSGDVDACPLSDEVIGYDFRTRIFFSRPARDVGIEIPDVGKYVGWASGSIEGEVSLSI